MPLRLSASMPEPRLVTLDDIETAVWRELASACSHARHPWRRCVVATVGEDGPEARTMVLRECEPSVQLVALYTDARSPKLEQLSRDARAQIVCWSPELHWQVRLRCDMQVETQGLAVSTRWARVRFSPGAQDYLSHLPPGTDLLPDRPDSPPVHPDAVAHHHFAVLTARVRSIDWLELHETGHRRARFEAGGRAWCTP